MRGFERAAGVVLVGVLAFAALALATGAGMSRIQADAPPATVDVFKILQELLQTPEYADPRDAARDAALAELSAVEANIKRMSEELQLIPQTEQARGQALYQQLQQQQQVYQGLSQQKSAEFMEFSGQQAAAVYKRIYDAVDIVAEREGYGTVFSTQSGGDIEITNSLNAVTQGIVSRPLIRFSMDHDLTQLVREEIGYEVPVLEEQTVEPDAQATPEPVEDGGQP